MDDDNIAFPNMVETFELAYSRLNAEIITSQMQIFEEPTGEPDLGLLEMGERWAFTGGPLELGLSINCYGDATGMYRKDLFDRVGFFHEQRGVGHEDWHFFVRASLTGLRVIIVACAFVLVSANDGQHAQDYGYVIRTTGSSGTLIANICRGTWLGLSI